MRSFTQDDAHIFCRPDQVKAEFLNVMDIIHTVFSIFNFTDFEAQISLRDPNDREKYIGSDEVWAESEQAIIDACKEKGLNAKIEYGEAAFYGPKARLHGERRHRPPLAVGHDPGGLQPAGAFQGWNTPRRTTRRRRP